MTMLTVYSESDMPSSFFQKIPDGLIVRKGPHGFYGIYALKPFPKGSTVNQGREIIIPNVYKEYDMILEQNDGTKLIVHQDSITHAVSCSPTERWLYLFDSITNHSCDPTTFGKPVGEGDEYERYDVIALKDIEIGDEITSDYNAFDYDASDQSIERCLCGSSKCVGRVAGYRYLSPDQQRQRLAFVDDDVLKAMTLDRENKFYYSESVVPTDRVLLCHDESKEQTSRLHGDESTSSVYRKIVAARDFNPGEVLYSNESILIPQDWSIVLKVGEERIWIDNLLHTVNKGNGLREYYTFDSFRNHSCDPNTCLRYVSLDFGNHESKTCYDITHETSMYEIIATKAIKTGDEITVAYELNDSGIDGTSFQCH